MIVVTLDATFIRSCEDGERHLEVQVGDVETESGERQVFGAIARAGTDIKVLICRNLNLIPEQTATLTDDPAITVKGATSLDFIYLAVAESPDNPALQKKAARQAELFRRPMHPYTSILIRAVPVPDPYVERTRRHVPLREVADGQMAACHFPGRL